MERDLKAFRIDTDWDSEFDGKVIIAFDDKIAMEYAKSILDDDNYDSNDIDWSLEEIELKNGILL